jgi:hypothetical protein
MIRISQIAIMLIVLCLITGCHNNQQDDPALGKIKIQDLAPDDQNDTQSVLKAINFEFHIYEMPADNLKEIGEIRRTLDTRQFRYNNQVAFNSNLFSVYSGRMQSLAKIDSMLATTSARKISTISILISENQEETLKINAINMPQVVYFTSSNGTNEGAHVGPGLLGLRFKAEKAADSNDACSITAYPVFALPSGNTIPQLDERLKMREFPFTSAAFGLTMGEGDFILLAPEKYVANQPDSLGSLFFNNLAGSMFFDTDKHKPLVLKPAVRLFLLVCTWIDIQ